MVTLVLPYKFRCGSGINKLWYIMDFLDPKARKQHTIRLMIGYFLMAVLIGITSYILVLRAYGFDVDRKTGEVIQNGLVYVDSAPDDATIFLNDEMRKERTNTRLALPEANYQLKIRKDGYRDWQRSFSLRGGEVERFTYPMLILNDLKRQEISSFESAPLLTTESLDRRWVLISQGNSLTNFIEYDLNALTNQRPDQRNVSFPSSLFTSADGVHTLELVEWSSDNTHLLVKHGYGTSFEFVLLNRENPQASTNINKFLKVNPAKVVLRDKKFDQWYIHTTDNSLQFAQAGSTTVTPLIAGVGMFKPHDAETLLYTQPVAGGTTQRVMLRQDNQTFTIRDIPNGNAILDIARFDGAWYIVVGCEADKKTYIYKDPADLIKDNQNQRPGPVAVLNHGGALSYAGFSQNTRFIVAQSGQHFEVYDAEDKEQYKHELKVALDPNTKVTWMDGHRMLGQSQNKLIMFDYEGSNYQELVPGLPGRPAMFDRDYTVLYTVDTASAGSGKVNFNRTDLRLEQDR
jgi:hypothetical protein